MAKICHDAWAIAHENGAFGSKTKNAKKGAKNNSTTTLELLCAKKPSKKHLLLEK